VLVVSGIVLRGLWVGMGAVFENLVVDDRCWLLRLCILYSSYLSLKSIFSRCL
jgi:hypothetical protein